MLQILSMLAQSSEFENLQVREEELPELDRIAIGACPFDIKGGSENKHGKAAILMQVSLLTQSCNLSWRAYALLLLFEAVSFKR